MSFVFKPFIRLHGLIPIMRSYFIAIVVLIMVATGGIYLLIPKKVVVGYTITANTNDKWAYRYLMHETDWKHWWPYDSVHHTVNDTAYHYNENWFHIDSLYYNALNVKIAGSGDTVNSRMFIIPVKFNEVQVTWRCNLETGNNPVSRWKQYRRSVAIKNSMRGILETYRQWLNVPENIYGFSITPGKIIDSLLVATRASFSSYPGPQMVDSVFQILRKHISKNGASITGYPMLNVINEGPGVFATQVALPVDKEIPETPAIKIKRMFRGNALVTKITGGGIHTIEHALDACEYFKQDNQRTSPAIPFQSLITDRVLQPDTTKWETIIYYPVH